MMRASPGGVGLNSQERRRPLNEDHALVPQQGKTHETDFLGDDFPFRSARYKSLT